MEAPSITFLNMTGDVTISWSPDNRLSVLAMIRRKLKEGYVFFVIKKVPLVPVTYKRGLKTDLDLVKAQQVSMSDDTAKKLGLIGGIDDPDVQELLRNGAVVQSIPPDTSSAVRISRHARTILRSQTLAIRPIVGG